MTPIMTTTALVQAMEDQHSNYMASLRILLEAGMVPPPLQFDAGTFRPPDSGLNLQIPPYRPSYRGLLTPDLKPPSLGQSHNMPTSVQSLPLEDEGTEGSDVHDPPVPWPNDQPGFHSRQRSDADSRGNQSPPITQYVRHLLPNYSFATEDLVQHVQDADQFGPGTQTALGELFTRRTELDEETFFAGTEGSGKASDPYHDASYEIFDIGRDGTAVARHGEDDDMRLEASDVWGPLRSLDADGGDTAGRITILAEPSPRMFAALHMTLGNHFDMNEILGHLVTGTSNYGKTRAFCTERAFEPKDIHQRTFFFVFKYYTVVGEGGEKTPVKSPFHFQKFDRRPAENKKVDHIDIAECSSVVALSFSGHLSKPVFHKYKRKRPVLGKAFSPFSPWHVLLLQTFPDDEHSTRDGNPQSYPCGPLAFLDLLASEYRDAGKRLDRLTRRITTLITPPLDFMFDPELRDGLLFEDAHYTYSRRYFWAYNTLGVINGGIKAMIDAYSHAFNQAFWEGKCGALFGLPEDTDDDEQTKVEYLAALTAAKKELDYAIFLLQRTGAQNESVRQEIKSLRDQLFSGSSVKESRRAIEQGDNIKTLTILSIIFLPLSFVASIFGITEFDIPTEDWRFAVTMVFVCVPFLLFVLLTQTEKGSSLVAKVSRQAKKYFIMFEPSNMAIPQLSTYESESSPPDSVKETARNAIPTSPSSLRFLSHQVDREASYPARPRFSRRISRKSCNIDIHSQSAPSRWMFWRRRNVAPVDVEMV